MQCIVYIASVATLTNGDVHNQLTVNYWNEQCFLQNGFIMWSTSRRRWLNRVITHSQGKPEGKVTSTAMIAVLSQLWSLFSASIFHLVLVVVFICETLDDRHDWQYTSTCYCHRSTIVTILRLHFSNKKNVFFSSSWCHSGTFQNGEQCDIICHTYSARQSDNYNYN